MYERNKILICTFLVSCDSKRSIKIFLSFAHVVEVYSTNCASFATRAQDKFNGTLSNEKNRNRHHWIKREIHAIVDYCRYIVDYHFHSVLHRIQEGTSIDIPWWWNQTDKLRYFGTVKTYHKSSEGKRQKSTDWMNKSLKKNENVKMFEKRQFLLICYPKVTNS